MSHLGRKFRVFLGNQTGSISVLTIGLFSVLLATTLILTDITSVYLAKRVLSQATEAATLRGVTNLDQLAYYQGEYNALELGSSVIGQGQEDSGIPIDCSAGAADTAEVLQSWQGKGIRLTRKNLTEIQLTSFQCDGFEIDIETSAKAQLPVRIPFLNLTEVEIYSHASAIPERAATYNFYGFDIR